MSDVLALDFGSTRIKLGSLNDKGRLRILGKVSAPQLEERENRRTADPFAYLRAADHLLSRVRHSRGRRLGLTSQRSSFLLWERHSGRPLTPLISWQDLRADDWCRAHAHLGARLRKETGLVLSPHYAATKLAVLFQEDPHLRSQAERGLVLFGTLDTWLLWHWTDGGVFETDVTIAARTMLVSSATRDWDSSLLDLFGVPRAALPRVRNTSSCQIQTNRGVAITATLADQAAGALPLFFVQPQCAYVNAGTGTFIMRSGHHQAPDGYQTALLAAGQTGPESFWEGGVNAGAHLMRGLDLPNELADLSAALPEDGFAVPDRAGLGAPYWRADLSMTLSSSAQKLGAGPRGWLLFEAYLFRIRQVIEGLFPGQAPELVVLSGGLALRHGFAELLAAFLPFPVRVLPEGDMGLWGAAWLAGGRIPKPCFTLKPLAASPTPLPLEQKYQRWLQWMTELTSV